MILFCFVLTLLYIGKSAVWYCSSLTTINIPNTVIRIEESAFEGCGGISNIIIPTSVESIGQSAFKNCRGLRNITIPSSVNSIGGGAFEGRFSLTIQTTLNSYAHKYAMQNFIPYSITYIVIVEIFKGDANGDTQINALDITAIQNHILGGTQLTNDY
jgi:hypothetical protein